MKPSCRVETPLLLIDPAISNTDIPEERDRFTRPPVISLTPVTTPGAEPPRFPGRVEGGRALEDGATEAKEREWRSR
jgi:hypothetical protein